MRSRICQEPSGVVVNQNVKSPSKFSSRQGRVECVKSANLSEFADLAPSSLPRAITSWKLSVPTVPWQCDERFNLWSDHSDKYMRNARQHGMTVEKAHSSLEDKRKHSCSREIYIYMVIYSKRKVCSAGLLGFGYSDILLAGVAFSCGYAFPLPWYLPHRTPT